MTREEYKKKIDELNEQKRALNAQIEQVNNEFRDSLLRELEEQGLLQALRFQLKRNHGGMARRVRLKFTSSVLALSMVMLDTFSVK